MYLRMILATRRAVKDMQLQREIYGENLARVRGKPPLQKPLAGGEGPAPNCSCDAEYVDVFFVYGVPSLIVVVRPSDITLAATPEEVWISGFIPRPVYTPRQ